MKHLWALALILGGCDPAVVDISFDDDGDGLLTDREDELGTDPLKGANDYKHNEFENLEYGIYSQSSDFISTFEVRDALFTPCKRDLS